MDTPNMNECSLAIGRTIGKRAMLYLGILVFAFALLLLLNSSNASAAVQHVSGDVSGIWHTGDTVYVDTDINVPTGQTLTISNGVNVYFNPGTGLTVYGTLNAISTNANAPINFTANTTSPVAGYWDGIYFNAGVGTTSVIDTAHIQYSTVGVQSIDSKVNLAKTTLNDISGAAVSMTRDTSVLPDLSVTLHQLVIYNVYDGIVINGIGRNLTVTINAVTITNVDTYGVFVESDVGSVNLVMSDATFDNAALAIEAWGNRTVSTSLTNVAINNTSEEPIGIWSFNGNVNAIINDVTIVNVTSYDGIVLLAENGNIDTTMNGVTVQNRLEGTGDYGIYLWHSKTTTAHLTDMLIEGFNIGVYYDETGSVSITMDPSTIIGWGDGYGVYIDAQSAELALTDVTISNVSCGISMISTSGLADLSLVNVLISGTNLNQGIIVSAESNNASVEIAGLTIEMDPTIGVFSNPAYDGINVFANDSISFTANDLAINSSYDGVQLTTNNGGMVVDVTGALITNSPEAGILMNSGAELEIAVSDSTFNLDFLPSVWISDWAIEGYAAEHIDVTFTNVTIGWLNGVKLVADTEYVEAVFTNVDITSGSVTITEWFVAAISGIDLQCNEGYVDATLNNVSVDLTRDMWLYDDTTGDGIFILSNGTVNLGLSNVDIETAFVNGIYVESFNGMIEATLTDVMVNDSWQSGILLYSDVDAVDLTMTDSQVTNSNIGDGIVAQGVADVNLVFDNVTVDGALDGLLALSTDGNVSADFTDTTVMNCETGIRILAPNGWILMEMDPSIVEFVGTGIYLDAMGSVDLRLIDSFVGDAGIGIEIHSFDGGINVLFDNTEIGYTDVYGLFADADNSNIMVSSINGTVMSHNSEVGWYLVTSNGSVSINVDNTTFEYGATGILVESSIDLNANVANSSFLGQGVLGMNLNADVNITLNVVGSTFDGQIAENAQLFYPTVSEEQYIIIQPEAGNWTTDQGMTATLPFGFYFNGVTYTEVLMSLNGWLAFGTDGLPSENPENEVYSFGSESPNLIAPAQNIWSAYDPAMDGYFHGMGYKYDGELNAVIFQWYVWDAQSQLKNVFEVILYENGNVEFRYAMMESTSISTYDFGINMYNGPNWNLYALGSSALDMDFQSVSFSMAMMSNGAAISAVAGENLTASIGSSSFSHYMSGGVTLVALNGWASVSVQTSTFSNIYGSAPYESALGVWAMSSTMNALVTNNEFDWIGTLAIALVDYPIMGGVDSLVIENNVFNEVVYTAYLMTGVETDVGATYQSEKTFQNNVGSNVGPVYILTEIYLYDVAWTVTETDTVDGNNLSGDINVYLLGIGLDQPTMADGMINIELILDSNAGDNVVTHDVSVSNNDFADSPFYYTSLGVARIYESVDLTASANLTKMTTITADNNNVTAENLPFNFGIDAIVNEAMDGNIFGVLDSTVTAEYLNNNFDLGNWNGNGLGLSVNQEVSNGRGSNMLDVTYTATNNTLYAVDDGLVLTVDVTQYDQVGQSSTNVAASISKNDIYADSDAVEISLSQIATFEHYFPPFEQYVAANGVMTISLDISNNTLDAFVGVDVSINGGAKADSYAVFNTASVVQTGSVNILDNTIDSWQAVGVSIEEDANVGTSSALGIIPVTVMRNTIATDFGIFVGYEANAATLDLRYYDEPTSLIYANTTISNNNITVYYGGGIEIDNHAIAAGGMSMAEVIASNVVVWNNITIYYYNEMGGYGGIYLDMYANVNYLEDYSNPIASVMANTVVEHNNVTGEGYSGWGIDVELYQYNGYTSEQVSGTIMVDNNTLSGLDGGIYVYTYPREDIPVTVTWNTISFVGTGIETESASVDITWNTISEVTDVGIELDGCTGEVAWNVINGGDAIGIALYDDYPYSDYINEFLMVDNNTISNIGSDGIYGENVYQVTIMDNTLTTIGGRGISIRGTNGGDGITAYDSYGSEMLTIVNNTITDVQSHAIEANYIDGLYVESNEISNVGGTGVDVYSAVNVFIENNNMAGVNEGVDLDLVSNGNVMNNVMSAGAAPGYGLSVGDESDTIVAMGNQITGFDTGVYVEDSSDVTLAENTVTMSINNGVVIDNCWGVMVFADNVVTQNGWDGLLVMDTVGLTMVNGVFNDNIMMGIELEHTSADWNVNAASSVMRNDVLFSGDLTVMAGGSLKFDTVDVGIVPDMRDGRSVITVMAEGSLSAIDTEFYSDSWYMEGGVSAPYSDYYEFNVYGTLEFVNVYESDALELLIGAGSEVSIETSTITNNVRNGIHIVDSAPVIMSSNIVSNPRNGIFIEGSAAAPKITDCNIANNNRGIYALNTKLEAVTDNMIVLNSEAGLFGDNVSGSIHDNTFLFNHMEIYVRNSHVSIQDNQIGYTPLIQVMVQFVPLLQGFNLSTDIFLPELGIYISPALVQNIIIGHVGIYAINSNVTTSGNMLGMLSTAVQVVDSDLSFGDNVMQNTIILPYMDNSAIIRTMSLPLPVWDGIKATNSHIVINGGSIDVLDDAVFLDHSTATIGSSSLKAMDFSIYLIGGSHATVTDSTFGKVKVEDTSVLDVWEKLTVVVKDPWGTALANVPVKVGTLDRTTDSDGMTVAYVEAYVLTSSGKTPAQPNLVTANFTTVPTTAYPGHASWSPLVLSKTVSVSGPTTVVLVPSVIVKFNLLAHAIDRDGKSAVNVTVKVLDASGSPAGQAQTNATGIAAFELVSWIKNADGTTDNSMTPYKVTAEIGKDTAQASTNLTGNTNLDVKVDLGPQFDYGPAIIIGAVAAIMFGATLWVVRRKP